LNKYQPSFNQQITPSKGKQIVSGPDLSSEAEIDDQIDDLIRQLEAARKETKNFLISGTP